MRLAKQSKGVVRKATTGTVAFGEGSVHPAGIISWIKENVLYPTAEVIEDSRSTLCGISSTVAGANAAGACTLATGQTVACTITGGMIADKLYKHCMS